MKMIKKIGSTLALAAMLLACGLNSAAFASSTVNAYTSGTGTNFVYSDSVGGTKLPIGSVVQLIRAAGGTIHAPNADGTPGGGDVLAKSGTVAGAAGLFYVTNTEANGTVLYVRVWNNTTVAAATKYGNSTTTYTVVDPTPPAPLNFTMAAGFATTNDKPLPPTLTITTASPLTAGTVGTAYSQTLAAANGTTPYNWTISAGSLAGSGLSLSTAGVISGTPTTAGTYNFTVQVTGGGTATKAFALTINTPGTVTLSSIAVTPANPSINVGGSQQFVATGTYSDSSTANITSTVTWTSGTPATATISTGGLATGVAVGSSVITATLSGRSGTTTLTVTTGPIPPTPTAIIIDDFEGASVGTWTAPNANSGYFTFGNGMITPNSANITAQGPVAVALKNGAKGMKVQYSFLAHTPADATKDWGDGWGAKLVKNLDLTAMKTVTMNVNWDGSANTVTFSLKDADGTVSTASIPNATLLALGGYNKVTIARSAFAYDSGASKADAANGYPSPDTTMNWDKIGSYSFTYTGTGTTTVPQYIDDITAVTTDEGGPIDNGVDPVIESITPVAAPAGTMITVIGRRFGSPQGTSHLDFANLTTLANYQADIISWSDTSIVAYVPRLASAGTYEVKVVRVAIAAGGGITALQSNPEAFRVTASGAGDLATIWPNPFNPNSQSVNIAIPNTGGANQIGFYIFDMTAKLVSKTVIVSGNQISWNGRDQSGTFVADGAYILRAINEDTKTLLAKGKILVIKR